MSDWTPKRIAFNRDQAERLKISRCDDSLVALLAVESISALAEIERLQAEMVEMKEQHTAQLQNDIDLMILPAKGEEMEMNKKEKQVTPARPATTQGGFNGFSDRNRERCEHPSGFNHRLSSWSASDWLTAVLGELGEAANVQKKLNRVRDGVPGNKETPEYLRTKLESEIADTFIYLDLFAQSCGFDLETAVLRTFDSKSKEIGYTE